MAQNGNIFTAFWMDTTTAPGSPITGLSATINIRDMSGNIVVNDQAMTELGGGHYIYTFVGYNSAVDYVYDCDPNDSRCYRESGVTNNIQQLISEIRTGVGGFSINYGTITSHVTNRVNELKEEFVKSKELITQGLNETNSHIDIAKGEIKDKIDTIEIPEAILEEKEAKKAIKLITSVDKKLSSYIESEMKEKDEISAITAEFTKQEIEDRKREKLEKEEEKRKEEIEKKKEEENDKKLLEEIKSEFDKQDEEEKKEKAKEIEKEIKELEAEMKEKEKELKTL